MTQLRILIAALVTLSLLVVPAGVGASAASMAAASASEASECGMPCPMAQQADMMAGTAMPGGCHGTDGKSAPVTPSACVALCGGLVLALPSVSFVAVCDVSSALPRPGVQAALPGHTDQPEPPPPRS